MIATVVPITMLVTALLRPLFKRRLMRQKDYFEQPSGATSERMGSIPRE
jgi:hypothetical protein